MARNFDLVVVTGATASGKTAVAANAAAQLGGEIISADSRQVYRGMDIGTGKDYSDYVVNGKQIPYHLIDIVDAGYKYNVFEYQRDFISVYSEVTERGAVPVVCGGSGMYLDSIVNGYRLLPVPVNDELRKELEGKSLLQLREILAGYRKLHNNTDVDSVKRAVRAIEIEVFYSGCSIDELSFPVLTPLITAIRFSREKRRERITSRLKERLKQGMIEEVEGLLSSGVPEETLIYYGLEYKYIVSFLNDELSYEEMFRGLETAIHQFAKRQATWFRGMERRGVTINWIDGEMSLEEKTAHIIDLWQVGFVI